MAVYRVPVKLTWTGSGSPGVNVFHVHVVAGDPLVEVAEAITALGTFYTAIGVLLWQGSTWTIGDPVTDAETDELLAVTPLSGATSHGQSSKLAPALAIVCGWRTTTAARRGRGRTFLGPLNVDAGSTDGTPSSGALSTIQTAATALISSSTGDAGWNLAVYGQENPGEEFPRLARAFSTASIRDTFAVLRSRRD